MDVERPDSTQQRGGRNHLVALPLNQPRARIRQVLLRIAALRFGTRRFLKKVEWVPLRGVGRGCLHLHKISLAETEAHCRIYHAVHLF
jgi:hypothetical protein